MAKRNQILGYNSRSIGTTKAPVAKVDPKSPIISTVDNNTFFEDLIQSFERSPTHRTCVKIQSRLLQGDGRLITRRDGQPYEYNPELEDWLNNVNGYESFEDVFAKQGLDFILTGNYALRKTKTASGVHVDHEDITTFRLAKPVAGELQECYLSNYWNTKELKQINNKTLKDYAIKIPLFEGDDSVYFHKDYAPSHKWYGMPNYYSVAGMRWIDVEYKIPTYNLSSIDNRFMPSGLLSLFGEPPSGMTADEYLQGFLYQFTGEGNSSKLVAQILSNPEQEPKYTQINDQPDGIFTELQDLAQQNILVMHAMHPSILMAIAGKLGSTSGAEVQKQIEQYVSMVIDPYISSCMKVWNNILKEIGFGEYQLSIANNNPISLLGDIDLSTVLSVNEMREELGYSELKETTDKRLIEIIGVDGMERMQAIISAPITELPLPRKKAMLKVGFGLDEDQINEIFNDNSQPNTGV